MRIGIPKGNQNPSKGAWHSCPKPPGNWYMQGTRCICRLGPERRAVIRTALISAQGVQILPDATALYGRAQLIVKVKEPIAPEYDLLRPSMCCSHTCIWLPCRNWRACCNRRN